MIIIVIKTGPPIKPKPVTELLIRSGWAIRPFPFNPFDPVEIRVNRLEFFKTRAPKS